MRELSGWFMMGWGLAVFVAAMKLDGTLAAVPVVTAGIYLAAEGFSRTTMSRALDGMRG